MTIEQFNISIEPLINPTGTMVYYPIVDLGDKFGCLIWKQYVNNYSSSVLVYSYETRLKTTLEKYEPLLNETEYSHEAYIYRSQNSKFKTERLLIQLPRRIDGFDNKLSPLFFGIHLNSNISKDICEHKYYFSNLVVGTKRSKVKKLSESVDLSVFSKEDMKNLWDLLTSNQTANIQLAFNILNL